MGIGAIIGSVVGGVASASAASKGAEATENAANQANATERYIFDRSVELTEPQREVGNNANAALAFLAGIGERPTFGAEQLRVEEFQETNPLYASMLQDYQSKNQSNGTRIGVVGAPGPEFAGVPNSFTKYRVGDEVFSSRENADKYASDNSTGGFEYQGFEASPGYEFRKEEGEKALERAASARGLRLSSSTLKEAARFGDGLASQEFGDYWNRLAGLSGAGQTATQQQISAGNNYAGAVGANLNTAANARASGYAGVSNAVNGTINNGFSIYGAYQNGMFGNGGGNSLFGGNSWG